MAGWSSIIDGVTSCLLCQRLGRYGVCSAKTGIVPGNLGWLVTVTVERAEMQVEENIFHVVGNGQPLMGSKELTRCRLCFGRRSLWWGDQSP